MTRTLIALLLPIAIGVACRSPKGASYYLKKKHTPADPRLYDTIARLDRAFFDAYNTCDRNLAVYAGFFSDSLEFYHDQGGFMNSKQAVLSATEQYNCGKVTRELVPGSIEVYPIPGFGAVEMGLHAFHNNQEPPGTPSKAGRFVIVWARTGAGWKVTRVISLH